MLDTAEEAPARPEAETGSRWRRHRRRVWARRDARKQRRRARRTPFGRHPYATAVAAVVLALSPVWYSFGSALTNPSLGPTVAARAAEWFREHGGKSIVVWAENWWYSHHQPPVGGKPPAGAIPPPPHGYEAVLPTARGAGNSGSGGTGGKGNPKPSGPARPPGDRLPAGVTPLPSPAPIRPFSSPLAGEGDWHVAGRTVDGVPAVYEAFLRPDAVHTSLVAGVAWIDTKLLTASLYSGTLIPGGGPYPDEAPIEPAAARSLVALFNAGFLMSDSNGGYYTDGRAEVPLRTGAASFVIYRDGHVDIGAWGTDVKMTPDVVAVRQNLVPLVENSQVVSGLLSTDTSVWGFTLGNQYFVQRSAVGVTADGALVYVAGDTNITDIASLLARAGAVRGMELDINPAWVDLVTYAPPAGQIAGPGNGTNMLDSMPSDGPARCFWSWWQRDFFTFSARYS